MHVLQGLIFDIKRFALHDGPGIRTTVFMKGCPLNCLWCHNPESKPEQPEMTSRAIFLDKMRFCCKQAIGSYYRTEELLEIVEKDKVFYEESGGGVTASGGEPLLQAHFLVSFLEACKAHGLHTAVDTCGYALPETIEKVAQFADLFLYDLKVMDNGLHQKFTGVENHQILSNLRLLDQMKKSIIIRIPLVEGVNDSETNLNLLIDFLADLSVIKEIHLLPYHKLASQKHQKFANQTESLSFNKPGDARLLLFRNRLIKSGYRVKIGG